MKNWQTLDADVVRIMNKHYTSGRSGRKVDKVVVHHNAGILTVDQIHDVWQIRPASAHYQVQTDGLIGQLVWDNDTAWHAGDWDANTTSIGIEHADDSTDPWHIGQKTLEEGAHLVAAICHYYDLGRPQWGVNVFPHSQFSATSCPATLYGSQKDEYMSRAQYWYDQMTGTTPATPEPDPGYVDLDALADKTIRGDYGNGDARKAALGDYYDDVMRIVNRRLLGVTASVGGQSIDTIADQVIAGQWGNGDQRRQRLEAAGYDYQTIQTRVNQKLGQSTTTSVDLNALADAVIRGDYGNGDARKQALGSNYAAVQAIVNTKLGL